LNNADLLSEALSISGIELASAPNQAAAGGFATQERVANRSFCPRISAFHPFLELGKAKKKGLGFRLTL